MHCLIACEYSGVISSAFRKKGHTVWSCDMLDTEGNPDFHYKGDLLDILHNEVWDLVIAMPPCTYLTNSAEWAYGDGPYHQKVKQDTLVGSDRREARKQAIEFFFKIWNTDCPKICIENPIGVMSKFIKPTQYIQPYEYGEDASKKTCLWLKGLPPLKPTQYVSPRIVNGKHRWGNQTDSGQNRMTPSDRRGHDRALTPQGWADAMASQWG